LLIIFFLGVLPFFGELPYLAPFVALRFCTRSRVLVSPPSQTSSIPVQHASPPNFLINLPQVSLLPSVDLSVTYEVTRDNTHFCVRCSLGFLSSPLPPPDAGWSAVFDALICGFQGPLDARFHVAFYEIVCPYAPFCQFAS